VANLAKTYTDNVFEALRYLPTWEPSVAVAVGDIAKIEDRGYVRQMSLTDLNIAVKAHEGLRVKHRGWASEGALKIAASGKASSRGKKAATRLEFDAKHAILFRAERSNEITLERPDRAEKAILHLHEAGNWDTDWIYVTHVIRAERFTVLISDQKGASAELSVTGALGQDPARLAGGDVGVEVGATRGLAYELGGVEDATPLYRALCVSKRKLPGSRARTKRPSPSGRARASAGEYEIVEVSF
jgi:hypothetical protein